MMDVDKVNATEAHWVALNESRRQYGLLRGNSGSLHNRLTVGKHSDKFRLA